MPAGGAGGAGGAAPAGATPTGSAPPYKTPKNICYCFVLDLACLSGTTNVPHSSGHSGGPAGSRWEQNWAAAKQDEQACCCHVPVTRGHVPSTKAKNDQYDRSYTDHNNTNDMEMMLLFHHKLSYDGHIPPYPVLESARLLKHMTVI